MHWKALTAEMQENIISGVWTDTRLFPRLVQAGIIGCLVAAFLGGKFSFSRFAMESAANPWLELRLWFTVAALAGIGLQTKLLSRPSDGRVCAETIWILGSVALLHIALLLHLAWFGNPQWRFDYAVDYCYVIGHACLFAY